MATKEPKPNLTKPLSRVIEQGYASALKARDSVEYLLKAIPRQQKVVDDWQSQPNLMAMTYYDGMALDSYPVVTRISNEVGKLAHYRESLRRYLGDYDRALRRLDSVTPEVELQLTG